MSGVPIPLPTDPEDVAWALQTASTLWARGDMPDALLWLRRAAQAAGDADDDGRALQLSKSAADLKDLLDARRSGAPTTPGALSSYPEPAHALDVESTMLSASPPGAADASTAQSIPVSTDSDASAVMLSLAPEQLSSLPPDSMQHAPIVVPRPALLPSIGQPGPRRGPPPVPPVGPPKMPPTVPRPAVHTSSANVQVNPFLAVTRPPQANPFSAVTRPPGSLSSVPPAREKVRSTRSSSPSQIEAAAESSRTLMGVAPPDEPSSTAAARESIASALGFDDASEPPPRHYVATEPPPAMAAATPEAPAAKALEADSVLTVRAATVPPMRAASVPPPLPAQPLATDASPLPVAVAARPADVLYDTLISLAPFAAIAPATLERLCACAKQATLGIEDEAPPAAFVLVLSGVVAVGAAMMEVEAASLEAGEALRTRGTLESKVALRLAGLMDDTRIAYWSEADLQPVFGEHPQLDAELRAFGDRCQALSGASIGALGERLDADLLAQVFGVLALRVLAPNELFIDVAKPHPGLVVVGAGEVDLEGGIADGSSLGSGEFLFPDQVMSGGKTPSAARAGAKGALLLVGSRSASQELLVTCAPLLEIFAGM